jgi:hypothetical protein
MHSRIARRKANLPMQAKHRNEESVEDDSYQFGTVPSLAAVKIRHTKRNNTIHIN